MGWYMVKSGLEDRFQGPSDVPRVSQYRLAAHLSLAFILYTGLLGGALRVLRPFPVAATFKNFKELKGVTAFAHAVKAMAFLTAVSGIYVFYCIDLITLYYEITGVIVYTYSIGGTHSCIISPNRYAEILQTYVNYTLNLTKCLRT